MSSDYGVKRICVRCEREVEATALGHCRECLSELLATPPFVVDRYTFVERIAWGYRTMPWDQAKPHGPFATKRAATQDAKQRTARV